jgi:dienelactone hydrolase
MSPYDPFERGPCPVGVVTCALHDAARDRTLPVEIWYPATDDQRGRDRDDATRDRYRSLPFAPEVTQDAIRDVPARAGRRPLVVFSHGFGGERRQTTHLCTHWASHGYVVAAMDHVGNTTQDMMQLAMPGSVRPDPRALGQGFVADRPADVSFVIDRMLAGEGGLEIDADRIGVSGHSFGGWTTLMSVACDERVRAALPLAPAGGRSPLLPGGMTNHIRDALRLDWTREVPTLYLVAELDTLLPLEGMRELIAKTPPPCRAVLLRDADHFHFCDRVEATHDLFKTMGGLMAVGDEENRAQIQAMVATMKSSAELCPGAHAYALLQGLGLAHMDAHLRDEPLALSFLDQDLESAMSARGVKIALL